jgi:hypothetical protein
MRGNGGRIGPKYTPAATPASGVWSLAEQNIVYRSTPIVASGGTIYDSGGYRTHIITSNTTWTLSYAPANSTIDIFMIAGGGAGNSGSSAGPGGGAGGAYYRLNMPTPTAGSYSAIIGAGGIAPEGITATADIAHRGGNSSIFGIEVEGGAGAGWATSSSIGRAAGVFGSSEVGFGDGGCGAGTYNGTAYTNPSGVSTDRGRTVYDSTRGFLGSNQTYYLGYPSGAGNTSGGGGGGGIQGAGTGAESGTGFVGGTGLLLNWNNGSSIYYGVGGNGGSGSAVSSTPGSPGGSLGGLGAEAGQNATVNTGNGGGGSGSGFPGDGGSGIIMIRYAI